MEYPDSLEVREFTADYVALGRGTGDAFEALGELRIEVGQGADFEEFATERARLGCAADGAGLSLACTEVQRSEPVTSEGGAMGIVFFLRHVATRPGTDEVIEVSGRGPIYAFDLSGVSEPSRVALLLRPPMTIASVDAEAELLADVAASLRLR